MGPRAHLGRSPYIAMLPPFVPLRMTLQMEYGGRQSHTGVKVGIALGSGQAGLDGAGVRHGCPMPEPRCASFTKSEMHSL